MSANKVQVRINGEIINAPTSLSAIQAAWHGGVSKVLGVSCMEGVCGSCSVMVKREGGNEVSTELGCQVFIEEGMQIIFLDSPSQSNHGYLLSDIKSTWDVLIKFQQFFPEANHCRACGGCDKSCPKDIKVERGVMLANKGAFQEAADLFTECVMCDLCMTACPENIAPNYVGIFSRRVSAHHYLRPGNLIKRIEDIRRGNMTVNKG